MEKTKITSKYQATIPKSVREFLEAKPGKEIRWYVVKGIVVVDTAKKIKKPVEFLTSQTKLNVDAVRLVKEARKDFA